MVQQQNLHDQTTHLTGLHPVAIKYLGGLGDNIHNYILDREKLPPPLTATARAAAAAAAADFRLECAEQTANY